MLKSDLIIYNFKDKAFRMLMNYFDLPLLWNTRINFLSVFAHSVS